MKSKARRSIRKYRGDKRKPSPADYAPYLKAPLPVDLQALTAAARWRTVLQHEKDTATRILKAGLADFPPLVRLIAKFGGASIFGQVYRASGGPYKDELQAWADALGVEFGLLAMVNCAYELEQLRESFLFPWLSPGASFGCAAAVVELAGNEIVHLRNLDWPIAGMGEATRVFELKRPNRRILVVSFPGSVGVLSGMVPHAYSVTINWAPPQTAPNLQYAPSLLLRRVLEECATYEAAVDRLIRTRLCTSVFYTVCGSKAGESCVIERTPDDYNVRQMQNGVLVQTNHYDDCGWFGWCNKKLDYLRDDPLVVNTRDRRTDLEAAVQPLVNTQCTDEKLIAALNEGAAVTNFETCQRMVFRPAKGTLFLETRKP